MKINIVKVDDWAALYIDGECKLQQHSIPASHLFECMKEHAGGYPITVESFESEFMDTMYYDDIGRLPDKLDDIIDMVSCDRCGTWVEDGSLTFSELHGGACGDCLDNLG